MSLLASLLLAHSGGRTWPRRKLAEHAPRDCNYCPLDSLLALLPVKIAFDPSCRGSFGLEARRINAEALAMKRFCRMSILAVVATAAVPQLVRVAAQEVSSEKFAGTPAELELIEMIDSLYQQYQTHYAKADEITDPVQKDKFYQENDPARDAVPKLLEFESKHQGTNVGLMALRRVVLLAAGSGDPDSSATQGKQEVFKRLPNYADQPLLVEVLRYVGAGVDVPSTEGLLRSLAENPDADGLVREFSKLTLAEWMISCLDGREFMEQRIQALRNGEATRYPLEERNLSRWLENYATMPQMQSWKAEARELLRAIAHSGHDIRQPAVQGRDERWYLIRIDEQATQTMPRLSELAEGILFKESHLRPGKPAPNLELALVNENTWSSAAQRGKVVIIQFSFKGCGPCEAMYPDLRELQQSFADGVSILSIMADEKRQDTEDAISEGKLTWNVHWDGRKGPIATRWAVRGFPTVYVIDKNGEIAGFGLRGQELRDKVAALLDNKNQPAR
jgi:thiol-disulfide isomerase/thioredoxin